MKGGGEGAEPPRLPFAVCLVPIGGHFETNSTLTTPLFPSGIEYIIEIIFLKL